RSAVGSCQNGSENASRRSARVIPMSLSMRLSRPASTLASRRLRRARATAFSQRATGLASVMRARASAPAAIGTTGRLVIAVSIQFWSDPYMGPTRPLEPPEFPTRFPKERCLHGGPGLISKTNVFYPTNRPDKYVFPYRDTVIELGGDRLENLKPVKPIRMREIARVALVGGGEAVGDARVLLVHDRR